MLIKPTYDKSYVIQFERGKDVQTTQVVDTTEEQLVQLIMHTMKGRFTNAAFQRELNETKKTVGTDTKAAMKLIREVSHKYPSVCIKLFVHTLTSHKLCRKFPHVYNLSPRQARIEIEKAIRNNN